MSQSLHSSASNTSRRSSHSSNKAALISDEHLKQFQIVSSIMSSEATMFWARSQHFLVANAVLLGFVTANVPTSELATVSWTKLAALVVAALSGFLLTQIWRKAILAGEFWIEHWTSIAVSLEPAAFGSTNVYRPFDSPLRYVSAKSTVTQTNRLFSYLWATLLVFLVVCSVWKGLGWILI